MPKWNGTNPQRPSLAVEIFRIRLHKGGITMKKIISIILCMVICIGVFSVSALATNRDVAFEETLAADLKGLGLFKGVSDTNFDLERAPTRTEALVMLIRVLGKEQTALSGAWNHPFTDVAAWADKYVGYAYENGLTNGISETKFGNGDVSAAMYLTFVLRALGYSDTNSLDFTWNNPFDLAQSIGLLNDSVNIETFWRADVVLLSFSALSTKLKNSERTLSDKLIDTGIFTRSQYNAIQNKTRSTKNITSLSLNHDYYYLTTGEVLNLVASTEPTIGNPSLTWTSSDPEFIAVENGVVTVKKSGASRARITATADNGISAICWIIMKSSDNATKTSSMSSVYQKYPQILSIENISKNIALWTQFEISYPQFGIYSYNYSYLTLNLEQAEQLAQEYAYYLKSKGYSLVREEDDPMIMQIIGSDIVYGLIDPTNKYYVSIKSDYSGYRGFIDANVHVSIEENDVVNVSSIWLNNTSLFLISGESTTLTATTAPTNATYQNVRWTSSDSSIVSVKEQSNDYIGSQLSYNVSAVGQGTATITATSSNGLVATCNVNITGETIAYDSSVKLPMQSVSTGKSLTAEQIYKQCSPAVFYIEVYDSYGVPCSSGSGFFITSDGIAVTCNHVIEGATAKIYLPDGRTYWLDSIIASSKTKDIAILKVNGTGFTCLPVGNSDAVVGGQAIFTLGSPLGLSNTISDGIISNPLRTVVETQYIQISAPISSGSSGGVLLNEYGQAIGITAAGFTSGQNLNLAIPINLIYTLGL